MELKLVRQPSSEVCTHGDLYMDDQWFCHSLEDVVRETKVPGRTAIPAGRYQVIVTHSPRFRRQLPLLMRVPNFTGIRIHAGNSADESEGCILVGRNRTEDKVTESRLALEDLMTEIEGALQGGEEVWIEIMDEKFAYG